MRYFIKRFRLLSIKLFQLTIVALLLTNCKTKPLLPLKNESFEPIRISFVSDSIIRWKINNVKYADPIINSGYTINEVKKKYKLLEGRLYNVQTNEIISNTSIVLHLNKFNYIVDVNIVFGLPMGSYCDASNGIFCKKRYEHNFNGNIDGVFSSSDYETIFRNGKGYWKDYYNDEKNIKEEGQVKNNYKSGKWMYYNPEGQIDSVKVYTQTDSVDVRFPHCLFNKTEPCY